VLSSRKRHPPGTRSLLAPGEPGGPVTLSFDDQT
jgi:hypothetical protein